MHSPSGNLPHPWYSMKSTSQPKTSCHLEGRIFSYSSTTGGVETPHLETKIVIYGEFKYFINLGNPEIKVIPLLNDLVGWRLSPWCYYNSPRLMAPWSHLSSLNKPHLRCGVASAWLPQHLQIPVETCRISQLSQYFPVGETEQILW